MAKRKKKQRKSKAQQEYERVRARLLRARSRAEKSGSKYFFDLPPTPKQLARQRGGKVTAKDYREAVKGLKGFEQVFKKAIKREQESPVIDLSMDTITGFLRGLDWPTAYGGHVIIQKTGELVNKYGAEVVARAISDMQDSNDLVESAEFYNADYGRAYMARMGLRVRQLARMKPEEWQTLEDRIYGNTESVPDELATDYFRAGRRDIDELIEEYDL